MEEVGDPAAGYDVRIPTPRWAVPLLAPSRYKGIHGGRGSGKSHERAEAMIEAHVMDPHRSSVCIRQFQKTLRESSKRLLENKIADLGVADYFEIQESVILSRHGSGRIIFTGMQNHTAESIKSLEGYDCAWVDEAQTLSQKSLDLLRPTIRKPGSELWFTWNPRTAEDPIDRLLRGPSRPPDAVVVEVNYDRNPHFPDVLRKEMEYDRKRDPEKYIHVWRGGYEAHSEARVFHDWRIEDFETPRDAVLRFGADFGFSPDPTVLVRCFVVGRTLYVDHEAWSIECEVEDTPELFLQVPESERHPIIGDSSAKATISHLRKHGFPRIMGAVKGPGSVEEGVKFLKGYTIVVHSRCPHVADELRLYKRKVDPLTGKVLGELEDKNNHTIDALRYACEAVRRTKTTPSHEASAPPPAAMRWK
jgi:phage terminase large subunit